MDESRGLTREPVSADGRFWWDGAHWLPISEDGRWRWSGTRWLPMVASTVPAPGSSPGSAGVDLLVCFDTTGSMDDKIAGLTAQTATFAKEAATRRLDLRWGLIAFGDLRVEGDRIETYPFTARPNEFAKSLRRMPRFSGGGNTGETSLDALLTATQHGGWRADAVRMCILITDEPPAGKDVDLGTVGERMRAQRIVVICVSPDHRAYRWLAQVTGGEWWDIFEKVPFERLLERLANRVMRLAATLVPLLGSSAVDPPSKP